MLRLDVAPIHVAYSQACFSAVLAFVDAAWPDSAFDPLRVLASMTLASAVQVRFPSFVPVSNLSRSRSHTKHQRRWLNAKLSALQVCMQERAAAPAALQAVRMTSKHLQLEVLHWAQSSSLLVTEQCSRPWSVV